MKKPIILLVFLFMNVIVFSQETEVKFDENLAKYLNADDCGMKK